MLDKLMLCKFNFISFVQYIKYLQNNTVIIYTGISVIQRDSEGIRICIPHMFNSLDVVIIFVFMQHTNNILDLLVTIGCNIQSAVAYRSTGMEIRFFHSGSTR